MDHRWILLVGLAFTFPSRGVDAGVVISNHARAVVNVSNDLLGTIVDESEALAVATAGANSPAGWTTNAKATASVRPVRAGAVGVGGVLASASNADCGPCTITADATAIWSDAIILPNGFTAPILLYANATGSGSVNAQNQRFAGASISLTLDDLNTGNRVRKTATTTATSSEADVFPDADSLLPPGFVSIALEPRMILVSENGQTVLINAARFSVSLSAFATVDNGEANSDFFNTVSLLNVTDENNVPLDDLGIDWQFDSGAPKPTAAVPEPSAAAFLSIAGMGLLGWKWSKTLSRPRLP